MMLKNGCKGADVTGVQLLLQSHGYRLEADGIFGKVTEEMVRAFQRAQGLVVDGIVGDKTLSALGGRVEPPRTPQGHIGLKSPWWARVGSALAAEARGIGYYPLGISDAALKRLPVTEQWRLCKADDPVGKAKYTNGTCGHFATWLVSGVVGDTNMLPAATGMNLTRSWQQRADKWADVKPSSSCAVALLAGCVSVGNQEGDTWRVYPCKGYARLFEHKPGAKMPDIPGKCEEPGLYIVEMPSHIVVALVVHGDEGLLDPRTGNPLEPGCYRWAADGTKKLRGKPHTFREWKVDEAGDYIHLWYLPEDSEVAGAVDFRVTVEE